MTSPPDLRSDALRIWRAGVEAVRTERLIEETVRAGADRLWIGPERFDLGAIGRIAVVGAGKAGAGMVVALERALGNEVLTSKDVHGWVNVPADCLRDTRRVHLHPARPAGLNEPTEAGVEGTQRILAIASALGPSDLCIALISGGGSALMPAPIEGITLDDKLAVTRRLSEAGADIVQLNTVRKHLSAIKGGGLARTCGAGRLVSLIVSDVLGDPLDLIASGPTVEDPSTAGAALDVLRRFSLDRTLPRVTRALSALPTSSEPFPTHRVTHRVIGNLVRAVAAAREEAERLGYETCAEMATCPEGPAEELGARLAGLALAMRHDGGRRCLISGGEPTVALAEEHGTGGRNQQLVLAALPRLGDGDGLALLSGGTDGEDGPTDAAGAWVDADVIAAAGHSGLDPAHHLSRNDAYPFFDALGSLIRTGPTHTNVCDLRVVLTDVRGTTPCCGESSCGP